MSTPVIAIVGNNDANRFNQSSTIIPLAYTEAVEKAGGIPLVLPHTQHLNHLPSLAARVDGFIFPGGSDLDPTLYNDAPGPVLLKTDRAFDLFQLELAALAMKYKKPVLGICRGAQVLNVALGGTLVQDIPSEFEESALRHMQPKLHFGTDHDIDIEEGSRLHELFGSHIPVNSRHHQSIREVGEGLVVTARSSDGVVEAAEHATLPIDLVQWHPELMMQADNSMLPLFKTFVYRCYS